MNDTEKKRLDDFYGVSEDGMPNEIYAMTMRMNEIGWTARKNIKKRTLVDLDKYVDKITVRNLMSVWNSLGKTEWEFLLASLLVSNLRKAWSEKAESCDITALFSRDLVATGDLKRTCEEVTAHITPWFNVIEETDDEIKLVLKVA